MTSGAVTLSPRATIITAYALLGFANFASIGIQIGGIGGIAPSRRADLAPLRPPGHDRRQPGRLHVGHPRGDAPVSDLMARLDEAAAVVRERTSLRPTIGVVPAPASAPSPTAWRTRKWSPSTQIPHFPAPTVAGHAGALVVGVRGQCRSPSCKGRVHAYEGYALDQVVFPARVLGRLGVRTLVVTNAARGDQPALPARRADDPERPHQPSRQPPHRPQRGPARPTLPRHVGRLRPDAAERALAVCDERGGHGSRGRLHRRPRAVLRDARRDPHGPDPGRRRGRHVDGARRSSPPATWGCGSSPSPA